MGLNSRTKKGENKIILMHDWLNNNNNYVNNDDVFLFSIYQYITRDAPERYKPIYFINKHQILNGEISENSIDGDMVIIGNGYFIYKEYYEDKLISSFIGDYDYDEYEEIVYNEIFSPNRAFDHYTIDYKIYENMKKSFHKLFPYEKIKNYNFIYLLKIIEMLYKQQISIDNEIELNSGYDIIINEAKEKYGKNISDGDLLIYNIRDYLIDIYDHIGNQLYMDKTLINYEYERKYKDYNVQNNALNKYRYNKNKKEGSVDDLFLSYYTDNILKEDDIKYLDNFSGRYGDINESIYETLKYGFENRIEITNYVNGKNYVKLLYHPENKRLLVVEERYLPYNLLNNDIYMISLGIFIEGEEIGHANVILINNKNNIVIRFDPHGNTLQNKLYDEIIETYVKSLNEKHAKNLRYYDDYDKNMFDYGLQILEGSYTNHLKYNFEVGYCVLWSHLFIEFIRKNPSLVQKYKDYAIIHKFKNHIIEDITKGYGKIKDKYDLSEKMLYYIRTYMIQKTIRYKKYMRI